MNKENTHIITHTRTQTSQQHKVLFWQYGKLYTIGHLQIKLWKYGTLTTTYIQTTAKEENLTKSFKLSIKTIIKGGSC